MTLDDAEAFAVAQGWPRFRGEQVWRWVHDQGARDFDEMTNLPRDARAELAERAHDRHRSQIAEVQTSRDGTRKLRLVTRDGQSIESVIIPDGDKTTQCISSQVGCAVDCQFCATAKLGPQAQPRRRRDRRSGLPRAPAARARSSPAAG